jgi:site-specific recombinase XerD
MAEIMEKSQRGEILASQNGRERLHLSGRGSLHLPEIIVSAGPEASEKFLEFFAATIRNKNTRAAYYRAVCGFFDWCRDRGLSLDQVRPMVVAAWVESHPGSAPTIKQHLAAVRMLFDYLVINQVVPVNPAASVKGPAHSTKKGKTPVLTGQEARQLLESIDTSTPIGLRNRALIGVMVYSFARISAALSMKVEDYYQNGSYRWLRLHEKGGKFHEVPVHHSLILYLDEYIEAAGILQSAEKKAPLFRSARGKTGRLTEQPLDRSNALLMVKRQARKAGLGDRINNHTFRATGITAYLSNGGSLEHAQQIAAHESPRTTKLYDRTSDAVDLDEIERIML